MNLQDAKVGQRIRVWIKIHPIDQTSFVAYASSIGNATIPATVLEQDPVGNSTVIGWKAGEQQPDEMVLAKRTITDDWKAQGIIMAHEYGSHVECVEEEDEPIPPTKKNYGNQCPCGIHPSKCDYHRP